MRPGNAQAEGDLAAQLTRTLGGSVSSLSVGPYGRAAELLDRGTIPALVSRGDLLWVRVRAYTGNGPQRRRPTLVADR